MMKSSLGESNATGRAGRPRGRSTVARQPSALQNQPTKKTSFGIGAMVLGVYCTDQDEQ